MVHFRGHFDTAPDRKFLGQRSAANPKLSTGCHAARLGKLGPGTLRCATYGSLQGMQIIVPLLREKPRKPERRSPGVPVGNRLSVQAMHVLLKTYSSTGNA